MNSKYRTHAGTILYTDVGPLFRGPVCIYAVASSQEFWNQIKQNKANVLYLEYVIRVVW